VAELQLLPAQLEFLQDDSTFHLALVGGMGSGKTRAGALKAVDLALKNPGHLGLIASTDASTARDTIVLAVQEVLEQLSIPYHYNRSSLRFELQLPHRRPSTIKTVTYGQPLVGFNAAFAIADELDVLPATAAAEAHGALALRVRVGAVNQVAVTTTPEGFRYCWRFFDDEPTKDPSKAVNRRLIRATTLDNPHLPDRYIQNIFETRTPEQVRAYAFGYFCNFTTGTVYRYFNRATCSTTATAADFTDRPLLLGIDFNVDAMSCVVAVIDQGRLLVVDEFVSFKERPTVRDTRDLISQVVARYGDRTIIACPDASGDRRDSAGWNTNLSQLRSAGFQLRVGAANPRVVDRVASVNSLFESSRGERRLLINVDRCPGLVRCLEQQTYTDKGEPEKGTGLDGPTDAIGYLVWATFPLRNRLEAQHRLVT